MKKKFDPIYGHNLYKQKEIVLCAAIWYKELDAIASGWETHEDREALEVQRLPINCDKGIVFCGHRHLQAMRTMNSVTGLTDCEAGESVQGFLTNYNRFVDRREGYQIALKAQQIEAKSSEYMYSEDLY